MAKTVLGDVEIVGNDLIIKYNAFGAGTAMAKTRVVHLEDLIAYEFTPANALVNGSLHMQTGLGRTQLIFRKKQQAEIIPISMEIERIAPEAVGRKPEGALMIGNGEDVAPSKAAELAELSPEEAYLQRAKMGAAQASLDVERKRAAFKGVEVWSDSIRQGRAKYALAGATADVEMGASKERITATRVGLGALVAGPVGAVVGSNSKKSQTKGYLSITTTDGSILIEFPAKEESAARRFAADVTDAAMKASKAN